MSAYAATGLQSLGEMPWGSHVCQFFSNGSDLRDTLVPYFKAGLENNERCLLVAMEPLSADSARSALRAAVGDFDRRERRKRRCRLSELRVRMSSRFPKKPDIDSGLVEEVYRCPICGTTTSRWVEE